MSVCNNLQEFIYNLQSFSVCFYNKRLLVANDESYVHVATKLACKLLLTA